MSTQDAAANNQANRKNPFFFAYSLVLLATVLIGFAPSFFLRPVFNPPPLLPYLYLHGAFLTGWFVWLVAQTWWIRSNNTVLHRRLGYVGAGYGLLVIGGGLLAVLNEVSHDLSLGITFDTTIDAEDPALGQGITYLAYISHEVWVSLGDLSLFTLLFGAAILLRGCTGIHKRLMLLAALPLVTPALGRISRWDVMGGEGGPFVNIALLILVAAIILHDLLSLKKIHAATLCAMVAALLLHFTAATIGSSDFGQHFVRSLGHEPDSEPQP